MAQLHFYVPESVAQELRQRAPAQGLALSSYLARLVRGEVDQAWPKGYFERVVGGWKGRPLKRPPQEAYEKRERL